MEASVTVLLIYSFVDWNKLKWSILPRNTIHYSGPTIKTIILCNTLRSNIFFRKWKNGPKKLWWRLECIPFTFRSPSPISVLLPSHCQLFLTINLLSHHHHFLLQHSLLLVIDIHHPSACYPSLNLATHCQCPSLPIFPLLISFPFVILPSHIMCHVVITWHVRFVSI